MAARQTRELCWSSRLCAQAGVPDQSEERGRAGGRALLLLLVRGDRRKVLEHLRLLQQELQPLAPALRLRAPRTAWSRVVGCVRKTWRTPSPTP